MPALTMTESGFLEEIERVNDDLARSNVPIHARGFHAFTVMAKGYQGPVLGAGVDPASYPPFVGPNLFKRIGDWYTARYGVRMNMPSDRGLIPVLIRGDVYMVRIPLVFGQVRVDIQTLIPGFTANLSRSLSPNERLSLHEAFMDGFAITYEVEHLRRAIAEGAVGLFNNSARVMLNHSIDDRDRATQCLSKALPDTNGARFSIHQHSEKMLKTFLLAKNICSLDELKAEYRHNLRKLLERCWRASDQFSA